MARAIKARREFPQPKPRVLYLEKKISFVSKKPVSLGNGKWERKGECYLHGQTEEGESRAEEGSEDGIGRHG